MAATLPGQTPGLSLFIDAFIEDLRLSRSAVSWFYTGATVLGSLGLPLAGRLLDRYGPRRVAVVLIALPAASCAGMRWVSGWDWARPGPRRSSRPSWKGAARPTAGRRRA
ncbi:MFS transporter [Salinibacter ruber]|uniref:MFS family permease n=1 Tax=Salinibacter ruber TaxID=146919 RepID=A0A9X2V5V0_9BACT|nr:MFS family permease [Salinibacter ruber]